MNYEIVPNGSTKDRNVRTPDRRVVQTSKRSAGLDRRTGARQPSAKRQFVRYIFVTLNPSISQIIGKQFSNSDLQFQILFLLNRRNNEHATSSCTTNSKSPNVSVKFLKPSQTKTTRPVARAAQVEEEEYIDDVVEIESDNEDAAQTEGQPIPVQIGHRPGNGKPILKRQHDDDNSDELEFDSACVDVDGSVTLPTMY